MKIALDTTALKLGRAGVHMYVRELLSALQESGEAEIVPVPYRLKFSRSNRMFGKIDTLYRDTVWQNLSLPRAISKANADVFHAPQARTTLLSPVPLVVTIYDLYAYHNPKGFSRWTAFLRNLAPRLLRQAAAILVISDFTRRELLRFFPHVSPSKIHVTHLGVADRFRPAPKAMGQQVRSKYSLPERYLLAVNTLEPRKNLPRLLDVFARVQDQMAEDLVLVGDSGWIPEHAKSIVDAAQENPRIHHIGYVPDDDLTALYSEATAYVFPSYYEGFGLPAVEAMACGCPVVASRGSSLDEVMSDAGVRFDPHDPEEMAAAILRITASSELREDLKVRGGANAQRFTWDHTAACTVAAYEKAMTR